MKPLFSLFILILFSQFYSQEGLLFTDNKEVTKISFQLHSNLIVLPIELNGQTLNFVLDSGSKSNILLDNKVAAILNLKNIQEITINGLGKEQNIKAYVSSFNRLEINDLKNLDTKIVVLTGIELDLSPKIGVPIHGILGSEFFENYLVQINYQTQRIIVRKKWHKKYNEYVKIPIQLENKKPFILSNFNINSVQYNAMKLLIDTGNSDALWLFENERKIAFSSKYFEVFLGVGLGGEIFGRKSKIKNYTLTDFSFDNIIISNPDSTYIKSIIDNDKTRNGSVGAEILKRFSVVFDYKNSAIYLKKNASFRNPFLYDCSGMTIYQPVIELPYFQVHSITPNSPAAKAGILVDDSITNIDGQSVITMKLEEILEIIKKKRNKKITLIIDRNGAKFTKELFLEDVLLNP